MTCSQHTRATGKRPLFFGDGLTETAAGKAGPSYLGGTTYMMHDARGSPSDKQMEWKLPLSEYPILWLATWH